MLLENELLKNVVVALKDKLGDDIICFDIRGISSLADYFVIASARSDTHVRALTEHMLAKTRENKMSAIACEGLGESIWTCTDFGDVFVHIMRARERELYNLEGIWGGQPKVEVGFK